MALGLASESEKRDEEILKSGLKEMTFHLSHTPEERNSLPSFT
jgi:hypothetical protein